MKRSDIVVDIPHAATEIPPEIRRRIPLDDFKLRNESDLYTDQLFALDDVETVVAPYSRIISDPNRAPDEIYTEGVLRALGVVILSLPEGQDVFEEDPSLEEMQTWIETYHMPFHNQLSAALRKSKFLIDGHSMWSVSAPGHYGEPGVPRADIILGNQYYCTCSAETTQFFRQFFEEEGYSVAINDPYPGRFILGSYCSRFGLPGLQIEVNRKLYLNEETLDPNPAAIEKIRGQLNEMVDQFCVWDDKVGGEEEMTDLSEETA